MKKRRTSSKPPVGPIILALAGLVILALAIGMAVLDRGESEPEDSAINQPNSAIPDVPDGEDIPYPEVPRISLAAAKAQYDANTAVFVDVRSSGQYEAAHIPGSVSLPLAELQARYQELPTDALIFLYCT
jgi:3-mercaptopyruvate sulfurtransferase SseA